MKKLIVFVLILVSGSSFAQNEAKRINLYNLENKLGIQGYDPVGYFNLGKAVKGKKEISVSYQGVVYNFSSVENKNTFLKNPAKHEPQYGGWCAGRALDQIEQRHCRAAVIEQSAHAANAFRDLFPLHHRNYLQHLAGWKSIDISGDGESQQQHGS